MRDSIMSMTGTIVVTNNNVHFYDSLAQDEKSWISHLLKNACLLMYL
ncbi:F pilus assembly TraH domain protein [Orientia tsutsugamushi str. UT76]|nr:F pilus assembly TraH domain protein [Orientia tsutsugamushi str. UT76]